MDGTWLYWAAISVLAAGALGMLAFVLTSLGTFVDIATTASFLTAPLLSFLNHRAMTGPEVPEAARPRPWLRYASVLSILVQSAFALCYVWIKLALS